MENKFVVSASPHIKAIEDTSRVMWTVNLSLLPTAVASIYIFGWRSLLTIITSVIAAIITEAVSQWMFKKEVTIKDGSAVVTGILLAFTLPPQSPVWMVAIGSIIAIFLIKQLFGGLGFNIFNPALAARAVLLSSWPVAMTTWTSPVTTWKIVDTVTSASPLGMIKELLKAGEALKIPFSYTDLFFGTVPGSLGETSKITILIGAAVLLLRGIIDWRTPITFIATVAVLSIPLGRDPLFEVLSGGLILGAFFMATDMVTGPTTRKGRVIFGIGCGALTTLIRVYGGFPEGVCYSILFMNVINPLIERSIKPRRFGEQKTAKGVQG